MLAAIFLGGFAGAVARALALQLEVLQMLDAGHVGLAAAYLAVSVAAAP